MFGILYRKYNDYTNISVYRYVAPTEHFLDSLGVQWLKPLAVWLPICYRYFAPTELFSLLFFCYKYYAPTEHFVLKKWPSSDGLKLLNFKILSFNKFVCILRFIGYNIDNVKSFGKMAYINLIVVDSRVDGSSVNIINYSFDNFIF